ncbi:VTT domain-containing protein [bacterium]|nr:VTT domain-containing protein [bacterium]MCI0602346.1 VTT domain-containing protein [bacterium]
MIKKIIVLAIVVSTGIAIFALDLDELVAPERIRGYLKSVGPLKAALLFVVVYGLSLRPFIPVPPTAYTVVGGAIFGVWLGTLLTVLGATINAVLTYYIAHVLGDGKFQDWLKERKSMSEVLEKIRKAGFKTIFLIRLSPVGPPYDLVSFAAGFARIPFGSYLLATIVGIIPATFLFCYLGERVSTGEIQKMLIPF